MADNQVIELSDLLADSGPKTDDVLVRVRGIARGSQESKRFSDDPRDLRKYVAYLQSTKHPAIVLQLSGEVNDRDFVNAMSILHTSSEGNIPIEVGGRYLTSYKMLLVDSVAMGKYHFSKYRK